MKLFLHSLFAVFCLFLATASNAQPQKKLDSLLNSYKIQPNDTVKVNTLLYLFNNYLYNNPKEAKKYALEKLALSKKLNYQKGIAKSYYLLGVWHYNLNNLDSAKNYYQKSLEMFSKLKAPNDVVMVNHELASVEYSFGNYNEAISRVNKNLEILKNKVTDSLDLVLAYHLKGMVYSQKGSYRLALTELLKAIDLLNRMDEPIRLADALNQLGAVEFNLKNFEKSIEYNLEALKVYREQNDRYFEAQALNDIGNTYFYLNDYVQALTFLKNSAAISNELEIIALESTALNNLGKTYLAQNKLTEAIKAFERGLELAEKSEDKKKIAESLNDYGAALANSNPQKALGYLNRSIELAKKSNSISSLSMAYKNRAELYVKLKNNEQALADFRLHATYKDSVLNIAKQQQIEELRSIYDTEKKEQQIALQQNEIKLLDQNAKVNRLQKLLLAIGLLLSLLVFLLVYYGIRQKIKLANAEKEALNAELGFKRKELTTHALHLAKKNELLESLKQKAVEIKKESQEKRNIQQLISAINFDLKDNNNWEHFNKYFEEVHKDFGQKVMERYQHITPGEIRFMALLKMNLNSKEIANILNISTDGVKKARQRLRKKMNLSPEESLEAIIVSL